jgi:hypothetical protein
MISTLTIPGCAIEIVDSGGHSKPVAGITHPIGASRGRVDFCVTCRCVLCGYGNNVISRRAIHQQMTSGAYLYRDFYAARIYGTQRSIGHF